MSDVRSRLDELLAPLGSRVEIVDLRWGIDVASIEDEAAQQSRVLDVCLDEVVRSRPLFVGLIGNRYGWCPPSERLESVVRGVELGSADMSDWSVTELEFEAGAIQAGNSSAVAFVRDVVGDAPEGWVDSDSSQVAEFRRKVRESPGMIVRDYSVELHEGRVSAASLALFEEMAVDALTPLVLEQAKTVIGKMSDPYGVAEQLFMETRAEVVVGRTELIEELTRRLMSEDTRVCLYGPSGTGKSTIWCSVLKQLRESGVQVVSLAIGIMVGTTSERDMVERIAKCLGTSIAADLADAAAIQVLWSVLADREVVIAVDALDGLDPGVAFSRLRPLVGIPDGPRVLCTTTEPFHASLLDEAGYDLVELGILSPSGVASMVQGLSAVARRDLPGPAVDALASAGRSPLWVRLAFGELVGLDQDDFETLPPGVDAVVDLLVRTAIECPPTAEEMVYRLFDRSADRYGADAVASILGTLAVSRSGVTPVDLRLVSGLGALVLAGIRRRIGLIGVFGTDGRLGFSHGLVKQSALERYAKNLVPAHQALAKHLLGVNDDSDAVLGDRLFHALLSEGAPGAATLLDVAAAKRDRADILARSFTDALLAAPTTESDRAAYLLQPANEFGLNSLEFLTRWLEHRTRLQCPSSVRLSVARFAATAARRLQPRQMSVPFMGLVWLARIRPLSRRDRKYYSLLATPSGLSAQRMVAVTLRHEGTALIEAGENRHAAQRSLNQSVILLEELITLTDALEAIGQLDPHCEEVRLLLPGDLRKSRATVTDALLGGRYSSRNALERSVSRRTSRRLGSDSSGALADEPDGRVLRNLSAKIGVAVRFNDHDEAEYLSVELIDRVRSIGMERLSSPIQHEIQVGILRAAQAAYARGDQDSACELALEYEMSARRLLSEDPSSPARSVALLKGLDLVVGIRVEEGENPTGLIDEWVGRSRELLARDPSLVEAMQSLSRALDRLGDAANREGLVAAAFAAFDESLQIQKALRKKSHDGYARFQWGLMKKRSEARLASNRFFMVGFDARDQQRAERKLKTAFAESKNLTDQAKAAFQAGNLSHALDVAKQALQVDLQIQEGMKRWPDEITEWIAYDLELIKEILEELTKAADTPRDRDAAMAAYEALAAVAHREVTVDQESPGSSRDLHGTGQRRVYGKRKR